VPDVDLARAVAAGITKVNVSTRLGQAFTAAVRNRLAEDPSLVDPRAYLGSAREAVTAEVGRVLRVLGYGPPAPPSSRKS
jgi:fructose/tagatose bisphosphate aldolase